MREIKFRVFGSEYMSQPFTLFDIQERKVEFAISSAVMQFTGLLDKNGKDIYEGDVMRYKYEDAIEPAGYGYTNGHVIFKDGEYLIEYSHKYYEKLITDLAEIEVIGNIYENPELLTP